MGGDGQDLRALLVEIDAFQPDDDACLEWILERRFPDGIYCDTCSRVTKHHRVARRRSYSCQHCGHHVYPTAGTIFHGSTTPLTTWFRAVVLLRDSDGRITAKDLERELGVTYKTAWRMADKIRTVLAEPEAVPAARGYAVPALGGYSRRARSLALYSSRTGQRFRQALGSAISQQGEVGGVKRTAVLGLEVLGVALAAVIGLYAFGVIGSSGGAGSPAVNLEALVGEEGEEGEVETSIGPGEPDEWFIQQRAGGPDKQLDEDWFIRASDQARAIRGSLSPKFRNDWQLTGPTNVGGRIVDLVADPNNANTIYVAAATGGIWKNTDGVFTMEKAWPDEAPQAMGALAISSDGVLYAGTGEPNNGGGSSVFGGNGIYRSVDGGQTWKHRGLSQSATIGRIVTDPSDPDTVYVAAAGSLFNAGGHRGIYKSTNRGNSWELVLAPENGFTGGIDLAIHPSNPDRIYAAMWQRRREPDLRTYGGVGSGLFRSDNGGETWTRLENITTPLHTGDTTGLTQSVLLGRIGLAIAPSNPNRLYVITTQTGGQDKGFFVSNDGGDSFQTTGPTTASRPGSQGGFGWWFGRIWVDPVNQDHLFVAGVNLRRSTNGGVSWANSGNVHADQHAMAWSPQTANRVYLGNDGGTYISDGNGANGTWRQATYEPYTQFYSLDVGENSPDMLTGGAQDNGCLRSWDFPANPGNPDNWNSFGCGDGEYTLMDPTDNYIHYGCSQYGSCIRRYDGPATTPPVTNASFSNGTISVRRNWLTPIVFDKNNPATMYYGGNVLNKTTDRGTTWTRVSPESVDLTGTFEPDRIPDPAIHGSYPNWGTITTIDVSKTAPDTIYLGTDTGRLWKTEDGGATWTWFNSHGLPERWVTRVAIDSDDPKTVWATFSGFRNGEDAANVYRTTDGGVTWENLSGNLPNAPVNDIVIDKANDTVFVGTDVGVFHLKGGGRNWAFVGKRGLPLVPVLDIRLHSPSNTLYTSTFGRSMWKIDLSG
jgi:photosystem II stability/assembly factor-like uncharacterized protein/transposase-like protein